jgi:hypothetical protein
MSLSSLSKRLAKVERELAERVRRKELAHCVCGGAIRAALPEEFEAEMSRTCPVHGLRRAGILIICDIIERDGSLTEESVKLHQLVDAYKLGLSQQRQPSLEVEDDSQES